MKTAPLKPLVLVFTDEYLTIFDASEAVGTISPLDSGGHMLVFRGAEVPFCQHRVLVDWFADRGYRLVLA